MTITVTPEILRAVAEFMPEDRIIAETLKQRANRLEDPYHELIAGAEVVYERTATNHLEGRNAAYRWLIDAVRDETPEVTRWGTYAELPEGVLARDNDLCMPWYLKRVGDRIVRMREENAIEEMDSHWGENANWWQSEYSHLLPLVKVRDL